MFADQLIPITCPISCQGLCQFNPYPACTSNIQLCDPDFFFDLACHKQIRNCSQQDHDSCLVCDLGFILSNDFKSCRITRGIQKYTCYIDCATCNGPDDRDCDTCVDPYATINSSGKCKCLGLYSAYSNNPLVCEYSVCDPICANCTGPNPTDCLACADTNSYVDVTGTCVCKEGYLIESTDPLVCATCHDDCTNCTGTLNTDCITCNDSNSFISVASLCTCKNGYYESNSKPHSCSECSSRCVTCYGALDSNCITCNLNEELGSDDKCKCMPGYILISNLCQACNSDCYNCTGPTKNDCIVCSDPNALVVSNECTCSTGFFNTSLNPLTCSACHSDCLN